MHNITIFDSVCIFIRLIVYVTIINTKEIYIYRQKYYSFLPRNDFDFDFVIIPKQTVVNQ